MDNSELIDLIDRALAEMALSGTTAEADRIRGLLGEAREQLVRPYPCVDLLRGLCQASADGRSMDRYSDPGVVSLWVQADAAVRQPHVPGGPENMRLAHEELVTESGAWVQARRRFMPAIGTVLQVWEPVPQKVEE